MENVFPRPSTNYYRLAIFADAIFRIEGYYKHLNFSQLTTLSLTIDIVESNLMYGLGGPFSETLMIMEILI